MNDNTAKCAGHNVLHSGQVKWHSCDSCWTMYCEPMKDCIFKWNGEEQCLSCTKLLSRIQVKSSDILTWLTTQIGVKVEDIEKKYKQNMVEAGHIIDDSLCARCGRKCGLLWGCTEEEEKNGIEADGLCCMCLDPEAEGCCKNEPPTKKKLELIIPTGQTENLLLD